MIRIAQIVVFFLELAMLAALAYCGYKLGNGQWPRWTMAIGLPALFIVLWGTWAAPRSTRKLKPAARIVFRLSLFLIAFGVLAACGHPAAGITLFVLAVLAELIGKKAKA